MKLKGKDYGAKVAFDRDICTVPIMAARKHTTTIIIYMLVLQP